MVTGAADTVETEVSVTVDVTVADGACDDPHAAATSAAKAANMERISDICTTISVEAGHCPARPFGELLP